MMKKLALIVTLFITGCATPQISHSSHSIKPIHARITYYGGGIKKVSMPGVGAAVEGTTVAAHPRYSYGTIIYIPALAGYVGNGYFQVLDRGRDVTKRKASKGRYDVFDIYVRRQSKISKLISARPEYMDVYVQ